MTEETPTVRSTGIGSWPGTSIEDATKIAFAEAPDLPYLPELPARGPHAELVGRGTGVLTGLGFDLGPAGWRLTDVSSRDHRRAISLLRSDLDVLEEVAQDHAGEVKLAIAGPWTLAATVEHPRGDKVLADRGARRELGQSLTQGAVDLVEELQRRLPAVRLVLQLDEPSLPAVLAGGIRTASGLNRHRVIDLPEASAAYTAVVERLTPLGVDTWVHCCAPDVPVGLLHRAGVAGVLLDLDLVAAGAWDEIGAAMEAGLVLGLGALPTDRTLSADEVAARALGALRPLELSPAVTGRSVLSPACGLARSSPAGAVAALRSVRVAAGIVDEQLAE